MPTNSDIDMVSAKSEPKRKWTLGRILFWVFVGLLIIIILIAAFLWINRFSLLENTARNILREQGIEADFRIGSLSKTGLTIGDVTLNADGETFFSAKKVTADYAWRDALDGRIKRLEFEKPVAHVTIDKAGNIIDGWLPPQNPDSEGFALPPEGIIVKNGTLFMESPFGKAEAGIDAKFSTFTDFDAVLDLEPTILDYNGIKLAGSGEVDVRRQGDNIEARLDLNPSTLTFKDLTANGQGIVDIKLGAQNPYFKVNLDLDDISHPVISSKVMTVRGDFVPDVTPEKIAIDGDLRFEFESLTAEDYAVGRGVATWTGIASTEKPAPRRVRADGTWVLDVNDASVTDQARRTNMAQSLTLYNALSVAPISDAFAPRLTQSANHILKNSHVKGAGSVNLSANGFKVGLSGPMTIAAPQNSLTLTSAGSQPLYEFNKPDQLIHLHFNADFTGPRAVKLGNAAIRSKSSNGFRFDGIETFTGTARTLGSWTADIDKGRTARLAPMSAKVNYRVSGSRRLLTVAGPLDYDGNLPGGYVENLTTEGVLDVVMAGNTLTTAFRPSIQNPITLSLMQTDVGWRGENLSFWLTSEAPVYTRTGDIGTVDVALRNASGLLVDDVDARHMDIDAGTLRAKATLKDGQQNWDLRGQTVHVQSDDVPGPGTDVKADVVNMTAQLVPGTPVQFTLDSPSADILSRLVNADHLKVSASGTPTNFTLDFSQGDVKFTADALPSLPMQGRVDFRDSVWSGTALTYLPKAEDSPINVDFRFENGFGTAKVLIPEIIFAPRGFQPQSLVPALKGKVSRVEGTASADIDISFGENQPLKSSGTVQLNNMNFGTLPGPFTGVSTEIKLSSIFPMQTASRQNLTVKLFDPGMPLENGEIEYELVPDGAKIYSAQWPMGDGFISLDPTTWSFGAQENRITLRVDKVSLGEFLKNIGGGKLRATGELSGILPIVVSGVNVNVDGGKLTVPNGGIIQFETANTNSASQANEMAGMAFDALKDFRYNELEATMNGPLDGDIGVYMEFLGKNPDVLYGSEFLFRVNIEGELVNIARNFKPGADTLSNAKKLLELNKK